ncbi:MAG: hypothetical protein DRQ55_13180 [Planctomycetota bacterium]|nr:MAG: hypothetical protein DRQ55_13180 [Planctomycetota bacterium]
MDTSGACARPDNAPAPARAPVLWLTLLLVAAAALRIGLTLATPEQRLLGDEAKYVVGAFEFDHEDAYTNTWPPGECALLAAVLMVGPFEHLRDELRRLRPSVGPADVMFVRHNLGPLADGQGYRFLTWARLLQAALGTLIVLLVYLLARVGLEPKGALAAAAIYGFYPTAITFCTYLRSETLASALMMGALCVLARGFGRPGLVRFGLAGVIWGLAVLTRSSTLLMSPLLLLPMLAMTDRPLSRRLAACGLFSLGIVLAVAPWTLRNHQEYGRVLLVDFSVIPVLRNSHNAYLPPNHDFGMRGEKREFDTEPPLQVRPVTKLGDRVLQSRLELREAIQFNLDHPALAWRRLALKLREFWAPTNNIVLDMNKLKHGGDVSDGTRRLVILVAVASFMALTCAAIVGLFRVQDPRLLLLIVLLLLGTWAFHGLTQACSRYRMPLVPLMAIAAGAALTRGERRRPMRPISWLAAGVLIAALITSGVMLLSERNPLQL